MNNENLSIKVIDKITIKETFTVQVKEYGVFVVFELKQYVFIKNPLFEGVSSYARPPSALELLNKRLFSFSKVDSLFE